MVDGCAPLFLACKKGSAEVFTTVLAVHVLIGWFAVMVLTIDPIFLACKKRFAEVFDDFNPHNL